MSITTAQAKTLLANGTVWTAGELIGRVESFYLDPTDEHPTWVGVTTSAGEPAAFIPLEGSSTEAGRIDVACSREQINSAPRPDAGDVLSGEQILVLQSHYRGGAGLAADFAPSSDSAAMIRSEERLVVSTVVRPVRRLRVRKRIVTEYVTQTIPLRREELVIEEETLDDVSSTGTPLAPTAMSGRDLVLILHEERPVVTTQVFPVERVVVRVDVVTDSTTVSDEVARENVVVETTGLDDGPSAGLTGR